MGRPLNKKFFGNAAGRIQVTSSFNAFDGSETAGGEDTFIISQRSTNKFLVRDESDDWSEVLTLVDTAQGGLSAGEFMIEAVQEDGSPSRVIRFYNRTVRLTGPVKEKWSIDASLELPVTGSARDENAISAITEANPAVVTSGGHGFSTGNVIRIEEVVGMTEVNDLNFTITVLDGNDFELDGIDSGAFGSWSSAGIVTIGVVTMTVIDHGLADGTLVNIRDVGGMTEVNGLQEAITSTGANSFTLDGVDGKEFTDYTTGGTVNVGGGGATIDVQIT